MNQKPSNAQLLNRLPTRWALAVVVLMLVYGVGQPWANKQFGLSLPSLASIVGESQPGGDQANGRVSGDEASRSTRDRTSGASNSGASVGSGSSEGSDSAVGAEDGLKYGLLREVSKDVYLSPAGLKYTPGSDEGHRLKHIEKHLSDQPNRPGPHGVFSSDMRQVLLQIDLAYRRSQQGEAGTTSKREGARTKIESRFAEPIGYVGGRAGNSRGKPKASNLRLIVVGNRVITAFPF